MCVCTCILPDAAHCLFCPHFVASISLLPRAHTHTHVYHVHTTHINVYPGAHVHCTDIPMMGNNCTQQNTNSTTSKCPSLHQSHHGTLSPSSPSYPHAVLAMTITYHHAVLATRARIASIVRLLGRSIGSPSALLHIPWASTPSARDTPNSTV